MLQVLHTLPFPNIPTLQFSFGSLLIAILLARLIRQFRTPALIKVTVALPKEASLKWKESPPLEILDIKVRSLFFC